MKKSLSFKQAAFLLPLLLLLAIFAVYPILTSVVYSLFDYRTNDPAAAGLYTDARFNAPLFYEDCDYAAWFLEDDLTVLPEEAKPEMQAVIDGFKELAAPYKDASEVISLPAGEEERIMNRVKELRENLTAVYTANPDAPWYNGPEKLDLLLGELDKCTIGSNFAGLASYGKLVTDERFGKSLLSTLIFTVISVAFELLLGMALALIMNKAMKGIGLVRTIALIPWAIPTAVSALMWSYMYDGSSGIIAKLFAVLGLIPSPEQMLLSAGGAMTAAILSDVWKTTPYMALLLLAGLQIIDTGLYESAKVDGASAVRTFFSVTLPLLKPSMLVALLFRTLDAFRVYDLIAVLTGGAQGTETLSIYAYKLMIGQSNYGYGSAVVVAMAACVGIIAFIFVKVLGAELIDDD
ncbi:MAG: sugar ABC transporter permease [Clostridia bacterium]|nr:sugar ABC transporter permease [Clostridia bacterium]